MTRILAILLFLLLACPVRSEVRIKELARIDGIQDFDLVGYGIIVGLDGTGDGNKAVFTLQSVENMLRRFGIQVPAGTIRPKNVAAVMITAKLPPFSRPGDKIDVTVSSIGGAKSLQGGVLLMSPLLDDTGELAAVAQGAVSIGGFNFQSGGTEIRNNYSLVGRVPAGGTVKTGRFLSMMREGNIFLSLKDPDFTTALRVSERINEDFAEAAFAENANTIRVKVPDEFVDYKSLVNFISIIENLTVEPDMVARVIINERTGTIVVGGRVAVRSVAISHGNLSVSIRSTPAVSQPPAFSGGQTVVTGIGDIQVTQESARMMVVEGVANVQDVARALNTLGVSPRDMISIFQAIKAAGALDAELVIL
jgi:flagellar P-ring protein precursor FlgI